MTRPGRLAGQYTFPQGGKHGDNDTISEAEPLTWTTTRTCSRGVDKFALLPRNPKGHLAYLQDTIMRTIAHGWNFGTVESPSVVV